MASDLKLMTKDQYLKDGGYTVMNYFEQSLTKLYKIVYKIVYNIEKP